MVAVLLPLDLELELEVVDFPAADSPAGFPLEHHTLSRLVGLRVCAAVFGLQ
jgi:hypothetical protein